MENSKHRKVLNTTMTKEQPPEFYNAMYRTGGSGGEYLNPPEECIYYPAWKHVMSFLYKKTDRILELGCGPGQLAYLLMKNGYDYRMGVDFSDEAIKMARARNFGKRDKFWLGDILHPSFYNDPVRFNTIICCEVLEHIKEDLKLLELIPKGTRFIFSVPNYNSKSHVRYFADEAQIRTRYQNFLEITTVQKIPLPHRYNALFVINSVKK